MARAHTMLLSALFISCDAFHLPAAAPSILRGGNSRSSPPNAQFGMAAVQLVTLIGRAPEEISFELVMDAIEELYDVTPVGFSVGDVVSESGKNMGSAKIFSFASLQQPKRLDKETTLQLFGDYYRKDVLEHPDGTDHANIRAFMEVGWDGVKFPDGFALSPKSEGGFGLLTDTD